MVLDRFTGGIVWSACDSSGLAWNGQCGSSHSRGSLMFRFRVSCYWCEKQEEAEMQLAVSKDKGRIFFFFFWVKAAENSVLRRDWGDGSHGNQADAGVFAERNQTSQNSQKHLYKGNSSRTSNRKNSCWCPASRNWERQDFGGLWLWFNKKSIAYMKENSSKKPWKATKDTV